MAQKIETLNVTAFINKKAKEAIDLVTSEYEKSIKTRVAKVIRASMKTDPVIQSLRTGRLRGDFGLTDAASKTDSLIRELVNSVKTEVSVGNARAIAGRGRLRQVRTTGIPTDYSFLIDQPFGLQTTEKGTVLPWLRWLLIEGRRTITPGFYVTDRRGRGRSGRRAKMAKQGNPPSGRAFRVPTEFAGTITNNFIQRRIQASRDAISQELKVFIEETLRRASSRFRG